MASVFPRGACAALLARLGTATALAGVMAVSGAVPAALAQQSAVPVASLPAGSVMQLEADSLVYDNDRDVVTASGSVRIDYGGNRLVADKVTYDRKSGRLTATGGVELFDRQGTRFTSEEVDITDDFADGFVNSLRVETIDKTYFASESARREGGRITTFNNGVYTACAPCEEKPDRPPIWRVKSRTTIWNGVTKKVRFYNSTFELFGLPIAYVPVFEIPDPTVKRTSGFLFPTFTSQDELGLGVTVPYYFALSPTYDLTVQGTYWSKQGFLAEAEFRKRFNNGQILLKAAGISQLKPKEFEEGTVDRGLEDDLRHERGMIASTAAFQINPSWAFGWNLMTQSDKNFSNTYAIQGYNATVQRNEVFLTGLHERNYFDLRTMDFLIQEDLPDSSSRSRDKDQPFVLPSLDYYFTPEEPVFGGELNFDLNARALHRDRLDAFTPSTVDPALGSDPFVRGLEDENGRVTGEVEWKRSFIAPSGIVVTPLMAFQADSSFINTSDESEARLDAFAARLDAIDTYQGIPIEDEVDSAFARAMATLGLELRWPVLFSTASATHILEPMAQVFARPNEPHLGDIGIPNEDAQSLVFDASTLFERDKFSGYDRIEGGTRANVGLRYSGDLGNGWTTNALFGQSYQLAGENSFDAPDLVNVGAYSGLETEQSDFVGLAGFSTPLGLAASASGRFDEQTFEMRRGELKASYTSVPLSLLARYAYIQAQPLYGFSKDRQEVTGSAALRFAQNWSVFATAVYDIETEALKRDTYGFGYNDECFGLNFILTETRDQNSEPTEQYIGFNVNFRTIGTFGSSVQASSSED